MSENEIIESSGLYAFVVSSTGTCVCYILALILLSFVLPVRDSQILN